MRKSSHRLELAMEVSQLPPETVNEIFARFSARTPAPRGELAYRNAFTLLVAVVLSAQATDAGVNKATPTLFDLADAPDKMIALGEAQVRELIRNINFFPTKARHVIALSQHLVRDHGGVVPRDRAALERLPGVGRKTANVVLNTLFGEPTLAVDTHVFRVAHRLGLSEGATPRLVEEDLLRRIPLQYRLHAHHWLILHGRYVCKARKPLCGACLIRDLCCFEPKSLSHNIS